MRPAAWGMVLATWALLPLSLAFSLDPAPDDVPPASPTVQSSHRVGVRTVTPTPIIPTVALPDLAQIVIPTMTPTPTPAPAPSSQGVSAAAAGYSWANDPICLAHPDRWSWQTYSIAVGFPESVVYGEEMAALIRQESGGDLCIVNPSSGATCWFQQVRGGPQYLDPWACASIGYAKWLAGGKSFYAHWYAHWN